MSTTAIGKNQISVQLQTDRPGELPPSLTLLHRSIENQYRDLPWPSNSNQIVLLSGISSGRGDIASGAKVVCLMQSICPSLRFDWIVPGCHYNPKSYLIDSDLSNVSTLVYPHTITKITSDFMITGPDSTLNTQEVTKRKIHVNGPTLHLSGIGQNASTKEMVLQANQQLQETGDLTALYSKVHQIIFPSQGENYHLEMGLQPGRGVFFDERSVNIKVPLTRGHCCPLYLQNLADDRLKKAIFSVLGVEEMQVPDYDTHSVNFGYAYKPSSWAKFIDFVAVHERTKNVTIILNQTSEPAYFKVNRFKEEILIDERLDFLKSQGYSTISVCDITGKRADLSGGNGRKLSIVLSPGFSASDMRRLQFASERLLATGDNTAAESWASRCIMYLYEDRGTPFLNEQIAVGNQISEDLGKLLTLFGDTDSLYSPRTGAALLPPDQMNLAIAILRKPSLAEETLRFCHHITENYSFSKILEGALKRAAWHHCIPELIDVEMEALDPEFKSGVVQFFQEGKSKTLSILNMPLLAQRVQNKVFFPIGKT